MKGCEAGSAAASLPFCDTTLGNHARAVDLAGRLTVQEMAAGILAMVMVPQSLPDGTDTSHNLRQTAGYVHELCDVLRRNVVFAPASWLVAISI